MNRINFKSSTTKNQVVEESEPNSESKLEKNWNLKEELIKEDYQFPFPVLLSPSNKIKFVLFLSLHF